jgi:hypothetical protein
MDVFHVAHGLNMDVGDSEASADELVRGGRRAKDQLYYRTKWPWPLKDRDYTLV